MTEVKATGGATIGRANATWPFATLTVTRDKLQLNASIIGKLIFRSDDIISLEPYSFFMSSGLKINHKVPKYKNHVVFWSFSSPTNLIQKIEQTGFLTNTDPIEKELDQQIAEAQSTGGFPIKTSSAIALVVIWNLFFLIGFKYFFEGSTDGSQARLGVQLSSGLVLLTCILLLTSSPVRQLMLKKGRTIGDIKNFIFFLMFICGLMMLIITLIT